MTKLKSISPPLVYITKNGFCLGITMELNRFLVNSGKIGKLSQNLSRHTPEQRLISSLLTRKSTSIGRMAFRPEVPPLGQLAAAPSTAPDAQLQPQEFHVDKDTLLRTLGTWSTTAFLPTTTLYNPKRTTPQHSVQSAKGPRRRHTNRVRI